jgi:hypothetical protein
MEIDVTLKDCYGVSKVYPVCEKAKLFAKIAGTKTLTVDAIENIKLLGYTVRVASHRPATL